MSNRSNRLLIRVDLAEAFGVHALTICKWEKGGMPIAERGSRGRPSRYLLADVVKWYISRELAARGAGDGALDPAVERALLDRRRREEIEHRLGVARGRYVDAEAVVRHWSTHVVVARTQLRNIASRVKMRFDLPAPIIQAVAELVDQALDELPAQLAAYRQQHPGGVRRRVR